MKTKITLNEGRSGRGKGLRGAAQKILKAEKAKGELIINLIDDKLMRDLNKRYRKKDKTTDVLSFNLGEDGILGEIYISFPTARKQAKMYNCSIRDELKRLTAHGLLHILGYTHKDMINYGA
jgi:probable rRNA maturation factor